MDKFTRYVNKVTLGLLPARSPEVANPPPNRPAVWYETQCAVSWHIDDTHICDAKLLHLCFRRADSGNLYAELGFEPVLREALVKLRRAALADNEVQMRVKSLPVLTANHWLLWMNQYDDTRIVLTIAGGRWLEFTGFEVLKLWWDSLNI